MCQRLGRFAAMSTEKISLSYSKISIACESIAEKLLAEGFEINRIIAITRGGMVPACILANLLGIKNISSIAISSYSDDKVQGELKALDTPNFEDSEENLFVDDLVDSGKTYFYIREHFPKSKYVALFSKTCTPKEVVLDISADVFNANTWIEFPWELESLAEKYERRRKLRELIQIKVEENEDEIEADYIRNLANVQAAQDNLPVKEETPLEAEKIEDKSEDSSDIDTNKEEPAATIEETPIKEEKLEEKVEEELIKKEEKNKKEEPFDPKKDYLLDGYYLSKEQKWAINHLINKRSQLTVLTGKAGAGKSTILKFLKQHRPKWKLLATTGKAALLIGATTVDSFFCYDRTENKIFDEDALKENMGKIGNVIIIDEASMVGGKMFEKIYTESIKFHKDLVLVGDWGQAAPVKDDWGFKNKYFAEDATIIKLKECHRQSGSDFLEVLDKLRNGIVDTQVEEMMKSRIRTDIPKKEEGYVVLFPFNALVDGYNEEKVREVAAETGAELFTLHARVLDLNADNVRKRMSDATKASLIKSSNLADGELLCVGCQVVITRNSLKDGFCNGDSGTILERSGNGFQILLKRNNKKVLVNETKLEIKEPDGENLKGFVIGYPLRAGYALTIHKCQGMTLPKVWVDLASLSRMRSHGLAYVALSRTRNLEDLHINQWVPSSIVCEPAVQAFL